MTDASVTTDNRCYLVIAVLLGPTFLYAAYYLVVLANDTLLGDHLIVNGLVHFSKREILVLFIDDWRASLPFSYLVCMPAVFLALFLQRRFNYRIDHILPGIAVVASIAVSFIAFGGSYLVTLVIVALVFCLPAAWLLRRCSA